LSGGPANPGDGIAQMQIDAVTKMTGRKLLFFTPPSSYAGQIALWRVRHKNMEIFPLKHIGLGFGMEFSEIGGQKLKMIQIFDIRNKSIWYDQITRTSTHNNILYGFI
jgi:hypothetical protein